MTMGFGILLKTRLIATVLASSLASPIFAQLVSSPALNAYLPQVQQLQQAGRWPDLERLARQAIGELPRQSSPSMDVVQADSWLILSLKAQGRFADAEIIARGALSLSIKAAGPDALGSVTVEATLAARDRNQRTGRRARSNGERRQCVPARGAAAG